MVADEHLQRWLAECAERILSNDWSDEASADSIVSHLLMLPHHLLHRVLATCITSQGLPDLYTLPSVLHDVLVTCAASGGSLTIPHTADRLFYLHLAHASLPDPGLRSLTQRRPNLLPRLRQQRRPATYTAVAVLLARALAAHPSLRTLDLSPVNMPPPALRAMAAGLGVNSLPHLSTLHITAALHADAAFALSELLKKLPSARTARLSFQEDMPGEGLLPGEQGLREAFHSAVYPAMMPKLARLNLYEALVSFEKVESPPGPSRVEQLLSFMHAPALACVSLHIDNVHVASRPLLAGLSRFASLRCLFINADCHPLKQRLVAVGMAQATLPALQKLTVQVNCKTASFELAHTVAAAAVATLTHLLYCVVSCCGHTAVLRDARAAASSTDVIEIMIALASLQLRR